MFYFFVIAVVLVVLFLISYKPFKVEVSDYMVSVPNRKIYYKWSEIKKIQIIIPRSQLSKPRIPFYLFSTDFEDNYTYIVIPKKGKILSFSRSQVRKPHPTLNIQSVHKLIGRKKEEFGI